MVPFLISSSSVAAGGWGSGFAVNNYIMVGPILFSPCCHNNPLVRFSLCSLSSYLSDFLCTTILLDMSISSASSVNVSVFALWHLLLTFTLVIQSTSLFECHGWFLFLWMLPVPHWVGLVLDSPMILLYRCWISRNLNLVNLSRETWLIPTISWWICLGWGPSCEPLHQWMRSMQRCTLHTIQAWLHNGGRRTT